MPYLVYVLLEALALAASWSSGGVAVLLLGDWAWLVILAELKSAHSLLWHNRFLQGWRVGRRALDKPYLPSG